MVRVGIIGCGRFSSAVILPAVRMSALELTAVCDINDAAAEAARSRFGVEHVFTDYRKLLDAQLVDAVIVVASPSIHPQVAIDALGAGYHVYVEKPPAVSVAEARAMEEASLKTGRSLSVGFMKRFAAGYRMAYNTIAQKQMTPRQMSLSFTYGPYPIAYRDQPPEFGFLLDSCIHMLDLTLFFMGPVSRVHSVKTPGAAGGLAMSSVVEHRRGGATLLSLSSLISRNHVAERMNIVGEGDMLSVENVVRVKYSRPASNESGLPFLDAVGTGFEWEPDNSFPFEENSNLSTHGYVGEMSAFAERVSGGDAPTLATIADGAAALELLHAMILSSTRQDVVELPGGLG